MATVGYKQVLTAIYETIKECGSEGAPAGILYAGLMSKIPDLTSNEFEMLIDVLVAAKLVRRGGAHVLYANGY